MIQRSISDVLFMLEKVYRYVRPKCKRTALKKSHNQSNFEPDQMPSRREGVCAYHPNFWYYWFSCTYEAVLLIGIPFSMD